MSAAKRNGSPPPDVPSDDDDSDDVATYACPACGATLYGWTAARSVLDRTKIVLDRCESCGLVVSRAPNPPDPGPELAGLERDAETIVAPNRESLQAGIGGAQWSGLEPYRRRLHLTPRSAKLLLREQGTEVLSSSTPFTREGLRGMRQTLINAFTLRDNFLPRARAGELPRRDGRERAGYALDWVVTVLVYVPCAVLALPLELIGAALGRGGFMRLQTVAAPTEEDR
jgi:hypothetical protein